MPSPGRTPTQEPPPSTRPPLPKPFAYSDPPPTLHYQGAEALVYRTTFLFPSASSSSPSSSSSAAPTFPGTPIPAALKHRPSKPYRHPVLDAKLTRARILAEARVLAKLKREGVSVPGVLALDWAAAGLAEPSSAAAAAAAQSRAATGGWMLLEWIEGETLRSVLDRELGGVTERGAASAAARAAAPDGGAEGEAKLVRLMGWVGRLVGRVHELGIVHGDLTTSNLMVRREAPAGEPRQFSEEKEEEEDVVLVDFGLAFQGAVDEDRAVDLYVLERAFGSSHPRTERLFAEILRAYGESFKGGRVVLKRLEEVRMRGRKKIMIG